MSRVISPKLSIGSILNDAPPSQEALPPINSLPAPPAPSPMAGPASMAFSRHSPGQPGPATLSVRPEYRNVPAQHRPWVSGEYLYGYPAAASTAMYAAGGLEPSEAAPVLAVSSTPGAPYEPQGGVFGRYPGQDPAYFNHNVYYSYTQRPDAGLRYGQKSRRFRRRYYQIHRKYKCSFEGCTKSYGSLNHLNTHIVTKQHGQRKCKSDFRVPDEEADRREVPAHRPGSADCYSGAAERPDQYPGSDQYPGPVHYPASADRPQQYRGSEQYQGSEQYRGSEQYQGSEQYRGSEQYQGSVHYSAPSDRSERPDQSSARSEDEKKEHSDGAASPNQYTDPGPGATARFAVPAMHSTPKLYSHSLPPLYRTDSCSVRLPSLPSIISQCSSS